MTELKSERIVTLTTQNHRVKQLLGCDEVKARLSNGDLDETKVLGMLGFDCYDILNVSARYSVVDHLMDEKVTFRMIQRPGTAIHYAQVIAQDEKVLEVIGGAFFMSQVVKIGVSLNDAWSVFLGLEYNHYDVHTMDVQQADGTPTTYTVVRFKKFTVFS